MGSRSRVAIIDSRTSMSLITSPNIPDRRAQFRSSEREHQQFKIKIRHPEKRLRRVGGHSPMASLEAIYTFTIVISLNPSLWFKCGIAIDCGPG